MRASAASGPAPADPVTGREIDIRFVEVTKLFGEVRAVDHVSFAIPRGSFHSFLGPSGCGKTTSLRLIAGFEQPTSGDVQIGGASVVGVPAYRRPANMVFQHYALFPHMDVAGNIGYGLKQQRPRPEQANIDRRVDEMLELVRLGGLQRRRIWELSGGQQQRVALARALINKPTVLLLDEPLAALDRKLRRDMQMELQSLQREVGITFVLVTHDQEEALSMSDSIAIMRDGRIEQFGSARDLYDAPVNRYVADFVGESNFFAGEVVSADRDRATIRTASGMTLTAPYSATGRALAMSAPGVIAVRPEAIRLWPAESTGEGQELACAIAGRVQNRIYLGDQTDFNITTAELGDILVRVGKEDSVRSDELVPGREVKLGWRADRALVLADN